MVQALGDLRWAATGTEWLTPSGEVVAAHVGERGFYKCHGLLVRESWLRDTLDQHGLALVVGAFGERWRLAAENTYRSPWAEFSGAVSLLPSGRLTATLPVIEYHEANER